VREFELILAAERRKTSRQNVEVNRKAEDSDWGGFKTARTVVSKVIWLKCKHSRALRHGNQLGCSCKLGCLDHIAFANLAILGTWDSDVDGDFLLY